jgi:hypothetical protein
VNSSEDENIFVSGTVVNITCTGTVGNPPGNLHWCYKRYGLDADFIEFRISISNLEQTSSADSKWDKLKNTCQYLLHSL